jgi:hypothetical protein
MVRIPRRTRDVGLAEVRRIRRALRDAHSGDTPPDDIDDNGDEDDGPPDAWAERRDLQ